jgi:adenylyltransferase/sulfurtransferase
MSVPPFGSCLLFDDDHIEPSNANRQVLYFDSVGHLKATVLARRLSTLAPSISWQPRCERVTAGNARRLLADASFLVGLPDNAPTRVVLAEAAAALEKPLVTAASSHEAADARIYVPRFSCCEPCAKGLRDGPPEPLPSQACARRPEPSVVGVNMIGAALAWDALRRFFARECTWQRPGSYVLGRLQHDAAPNPCVCHILRRLAAADGDRHG